MSENQKYKVGDCFQVSGKTITINRITTEQYLTTTGVKEEHEYELDINGEKEIKNEEEFLLLISKKSGTVLPLYIAFSNGRIIAFDETSDGLVRMIEENFFMSNNQYTIKKTTYVYP